MTYDKYMPSRTNGAGLDMAKCQIAAETCACFNFRKASRVVTQLFDEALAPCGLRSTQVVILLAVHVNTELTAAQLADALVTDRSTLTRNLGPLVKRRLVRMATGQDRRTRLISLTPSGEEVLAKAVPLWEVAQTRFVENMGGARWKKMLGDLNAAVDAARA